VALQSAAAAEFERAADALQWVEGTQAPMTFQRRRDMTQAQGPQAGAQAPLDPVRPRGTCMYCGEHVGAAGDMRRHIDEFHPTYPPPAVTAAPGPDEPLTPVKFAPNECPRCGEVQPPRMMLRHTRLCQQRPRE